MRRKSKKNKDLNVNQKSFYFEDYLETNQRKKKVKNSKISQDRIYILFFLFFSLITIFSTKIIFVSLKNIEIYSKKRDLKGFLEKQNNKVFKFLLSKKIILPFFKTFFPGSGADYHYFGTIPFNGKGKLTVNENCQLNGSKNIYVIDGSVFNFKTNKYPLGIVMANARRIGQYLAKS